MKRYLVMIAFMLASVAAAFSQNNDGFYLNTPTYGKNLEQMPDDNSFAFMRDENNDIQRRKIIRKKSKSDGEEVFEPGYAGRIEVGKQFAVGSVGIDRYMLNIINGIQFNPYLTLSFGVGVRNNAKSQRTFVPVFVEFRGKFVERVDALYLTFAVGYSYDASNDYEGVGEYISPGLGFSTIISDQLVLNFGISYEIQREDYSVNLLSGYPPIKLKSFMRAISLNIGISF